jgi:signal transduction histidine kinase
MIIASIADNGKGFDLEKVLHPESPERGFGIIGMQERVSLLGGRIDIQSRPGFGTHMNIEIPYQKGSGGNEKNTGPIG